MPKIETLDGKTVVLSDELLAFNSRVVSPVTRINATSEQINRVIGLTRHYAENGRTAESQRRQFAVIDDSCFDQCESGIVAGLTKVELKELYNTAAMMGNQLCAVFSVRAILQKTMQIYAKA